MRRLLPMLIWLMFAVMAGNGVAHASEAMCCPGDDQSSAVMVCAEPGADTPVDTRSDRDSPTAHPHSVCHGHHAVVAVDLPGLPGLTAGTVIVGSRVAAGLFAHTDDPALRPPIA